MATIKKIVASEVINSRGYPTIYASLILDNDSKVSTSVPSLERLYDYQVMELKDNDENRFGGKGVSRAVSFINDLVGPKLKGVDLSKQLEIDDWLTKSDNTKTKRVLGVNTILTISRLVAKAAASDQKIPLFKYINNLFNKIVQPGASIDKLPSPIFPLMMGGKHGQVNLDFKEFQIVPSSSLTYSHSYQTGVDMYHLLRQMYKFSFSYNLDVVDAIKDTVERKGMVFGRDIFLGINFGASAFHSGNRYVIKDRQQPINGGEFLNFIFKSVLSKYSLLMATDPFSNEDWQNWNKLNELVPSETYLVADELVGSNKERLERAIKEKSCSAVIIRPNQVGTVTETIALVGIAKKSQISYQIGSDFEETNDNFIADFSVGIGTEFVNFGPPVHGENVAKYNRLLEIERELKIRK
ncbi:hypothetical protein M1328_00335 [Patescibacteria group bacterium]|nr:hypothetical protein [Patescibacteria group bacterium]